MKKYLLILILICGCNPLGQDSDYDGLLFCDGGFETITRECAAAFDYNAIGSATINFSTNNIGDLYLYRTHEGDFGVLRIDFVNSSNCDLNTSYRTLDSTGVITYSSDNLFTGGSGGNLQLDAGTTDILNVVGTPPCYFNNSIGTNAKYIPYVTDHD